MSVIFRCRLADTSWRTLQEDTDAKPRRIASEVPRDGGCSIRCHVRRRSAGTADHHDPAGRSRAPERRGIASVTIGAAFDHRSPGESGRGGGIALSEMPEPGRAGRRRAGSSASAFEDASRETGVPTLEIPLPVLQDGLFPPWTLNW